MDDTQEYGAHELWSKVQMGELPDIALFAFTAAGSPWEEYSLVKHDDHTKLAAINALLQQGYFVSETTVVGDSVLFRINKLVGA